MNVNAKYFCSALSEINVKDRVFANSSGRGRGGGGRGGNSWH